MLKYRKIVFNLLLYNELCFYMNDEGRNIFFFEFIFRYLLTDALLCVNGGCFMSQRSLRYVEKQAPLHYKTASIAL